MNKSEEAIKDFIVKVSSIQENEKKDRNNKFLGWISGYVPEEIILAAGFIPFRISGISSTISLSKTYFSGNVSSDVQALLENSLKGEYDFLEGIIIGGETDTIKRLYDAWLHFAKKQKFVHLLDIPKFVANSALEHYRESALFLIKEIENSFGKDISNDALLSAIDVCQKTKNLLDQLNDLRKTSNPAINSLQMKEICRLGVSGIKNTFNYELEVLVNYLCKDSGNNGTLPNTKPRFLITGSSQEGTELLSIIESSGGSLVCEDLDSSLRYFRNPVSRMNGDSLSAVIAAYFKKPPSATVTNFSTRGKYLLNLIKEFKVDGVIYHVLKFDDPYLFEFPDIKIFLEKNNIPVIRIETETGEVSKGRATTRIQAFIDILSARKSRPYKGKTHAC